MAKAQPQKQPVTIQAPNNPIMVSKSAGLPPPVMAPPPPVATPAKPSMGTSFAGGTPHSSVSGAAAGQPGVDPRMAMQMLKRGV